MNLHSWTNFNQALNELPEHESVGTYKIDIVKAAYYNPPVELYQLDGRFFYQGSQNADYSTHPVFIDIGDYKYWLRS